MNLIFNKIFKDAKDTDDICVYQGNFKSDLDIIRSITSMRVTHKVHVHKQALATKYFYTNQTAIYASCHSE